MEWQTFTFFAGLLALWAGLMLGVIKWMLDRQGKALEQQMEGLNTLFNRSVTDQQQLERDLLAFKTEVALNYVRREDWIRTAAVLEAKIDGVLHKL